MLCQDVTITLHLDGLTKEEYQKKINEIEAIDDGGNMTTYTYDPESKGEIDKLMTDNKNKHKIKKRRPCRLCGGEADVTRLYDTNCTNPTCRIYSVNVNVDIWNGDKKE